MNKTINQSFFAFLVEDQRCVHFGYPYFVFKAMLVFSGSERCYHTLMSEKTETAKNVNEAIKRWRHKRLPTKFREFKETKVLPMYELKLSSKLQGKLFQVVSRWEHMDYVPVHFYKWQIGRLGTYQKTIPVGENVFATGRVADYRIKEERLEQNAIEVLTTRGVVFVFWKDLKELKPSADSQSVD